ncbi:hypothetical protein SBOR_0565 [Sclerotinia borealis F-4128]|uniref:Zn(2)-C6 fungal-type domain-containing protein n=1 Tax=Sclerotinia borealis (strain F-4128) TaxID=1432307 RepID=W9CT38_SCLBF|nr:hypothetical protein SBOR_0565 [Sclerotinia borealis F-4128]
MNGLLRSKQGCWTCRLRKKKCDERKPSPCLTCESLAITCYEHGVKPEWMDNGPREKEMANRIKQIVKHTSRRKGRLASASADQKNGDAEASAISLAPKPTAVSSNRSSIVIGDVDHQRPNSETSPAHSEQSASADASMGSTPDSGNSFPSTPSITGNEAALLMHFLDNVFSLQYPMYKPEVAEGGRGWLLSLLLKTKPLYHASIGLSAYHRGVVLRGISHGACTKPSIAEQEGHLAICLTEFQDAFRLAQKSVSDYSICPDNGLEIMACVVQLVFFELFGVRKSSWQIHLRAATDIFGQAYRKHTTELGLLVNNESTSDTLSTLCKLGDSENTITFQFLFGVVLWLDIVSCVTTGKSPQLLDLHPVAFGAKAQIKLEKIMGCKNWAMTEIGRISMLHESKRDGLQGGIFDAHSFENQVENIRQTIRRGLNEQFLSELRITNPSSTSHVESRIGPQDIITRLFTRAAYIYLELVAGGFKSIEENPDLHNIIAGPMTILSTLLRGDTFRAIKYVLFASIEGPLNASSEYHLTSSGKVAALLCSKCQQNYYLKPLNSLEQRLTTRVSGRKYILKLPFRNAIRIPLDTQPRLLQYEASQQRHQEFTLLLGISSQNVTGAIKVA